MGQYLNYNKTLEIQYKESRHVWQAISS